MIELPPGDALPRMRAPLEDAREWVDRLAALECPALTTRRARRAEQSGARWDPIVWQGAHGANVVDVLGNLYVDLASGFGVAWIGHTHPRVVAAVREQAGALIHGFGDVHPSDAKIRALDRVAHLTSSLVSEPRVILGVHGGDAIEAALKTAALFTRSPGALAFEGGYHGLGHGPLAVSGYKESFRAPFADQLNPHVVFAPWPAEHDALEVALARVEHAWGRNEIGAVVVEPIQGRGGVRVPPSGFLRGLAALARSRGALLVVDEVLTGLGRCGLEWACGDEVRPDLLCIGKALGGGMPISACIGSREVMEAWGEPGGEAIHTATFFGHPLACAGAVATLEVIESERLTDRARAAEREWRGALEELRAHRCVRDVRGRGLLWGLELDSGDRALAIIARLLMRGFITLPAGADASVIQILPPATLSAAQRAAFLEALERELAEADA